MTVQSRIQQIADSIRTTLDDQFRADDDADLSLVSPLDGETLFELYDDYRGGTWSVQVNGETFNENEFLPGQDGAKARVAEILAEQIVATEDLLAYAKASGLLPA